MKSSVCILQGPIVLKMSQNVAKFMAYISLMNWFVISRKVATCTSQPVLDTTVLVDI